MIGSKLARCALWSTSAAFLIIAANIENRSAPADSPRAGIAEMRFTPAMLIDGGANWFPPGPEFPLQNELNAMTVADQERAAGR